MQSNVKLLDHSIIPSALIVELRLSEQKQIVLTFLLGKTTVSVFLRQASGCIRSPSTAMASDEALFLAVTRWPIFDGNSLS